MFPALALHQLRRALVPALLIAATVLAISSFEIDQIRMAEEKAAFFGGNAVHIHRVLAWLPLPSGSGSMVLCFAGLLVPSAFQLYALIIFVFFFLGMLGIYRGPML